VSVDVRELAGLAHAWDVWARPKQVPPDTSWRSFGFITGRGFGKTRALCEFVIGEVMAARAGHIGYAAQKLDVAEDAMTHGPDGLVTLSPPWFKPTMQKGHVVWPNGAEAIPFTPEVPDGPRNYSHDLLWLAEMSSWPASTRDEFFSNMRYGLRKGLGRMVFDTTPKARNPLVRYLIERSSRDPVRHILVRGTTYENQQNLTVDFAAELEADYGGTQKGREELLGEFLDDADGALFKSAWIEAHRRDLPPTLKRRVISVDPAISTKRGTDATGIVDCGLGPDDQGFVIADHTDRLTASAWAQIVVGLYLDGRCDCVVVERNRGGELVAEVLRGHAGNRGVRVEVVGPDAVTRHVSGTIYVKEVHARRSKEVRAEPVATAMERGRVSFVRGADLADLEDLLTTWVPGQGESPNALDAMVHGLSELLDLGREQPKRSDTVGAAKLQALITKTPAAAPNIATLLGGRRGGRRL
jgi:phage terminase large subunit-like protein